MKYFRMLVLTLLISFAVQPPGFSQEPSDQKSDTVRIGGRLYERITFFRPLEIQQSAPQLPGSLVEYDWPNNQNQPQANLSVNPLSKQLAPADFCVQFLTSANPSLRFDPGRPYEVQTYFSQNKTLYKFQTGPMTIYEARRARDEIVAAGVYLDAFVASYSSPAIR